eukprot:COSAG02_NODE_332_length_24474_cov_23.190949_13_plen_61_part_00
MGGTGEAVVASDNNAERMAHGAVGAAAAARAEPRGWRYRVLFIHVFEHDLFIVLCRNLPR